MNIAQVEENVRQVLLGSKRDRFIFDLLLAYGKPKASIKRLQTSGTGSYNLSKQVDTVLWKKQVLFLPTSNQDVAAAVKEALISDAATKHKPRFVVATNFERLAAADTKTGDRLEISFVELQKHFDFFLPWAGMEKAKHAPENPADVKAAEKMAKLFDLIKAQNRASDSDSIHSLNVFLSRLLFCFFAEDTGIFIDRLFSKSVESHTSKDGGDLEEYLQKLFKALNAKDRTRLPAYLKAFPYVNGGLFSEEHPVPKFSAKSRAILIECGADLNWSDINPDIFGSMIQAVVDVEQRGNMGMHYTSVANIMRVVGPLFLNDLYEELEKSRGSAKRLNDLLQKISSIRIFDPACGSGNFLIIAYKELRKLEMEVFNQLAELNKQTDFAMSTVRLSQFYGIELDDFAHEIAILSMWLAEHQMNLAFYNRFGKTSPTLPLKPSGHIICGNAALVPWESVCPFSENATYILGNPPYLGARNQSPDQKEELRKIFEGDDEYKDSDYVTGWILKASAYIRGRNSMFAFVTTNSICQGEQVAYVWPRVWSKNLEIGFAHSTFKWSNSAKKNAGVSCVVVGIRNRSAKPKLLFEGSTSKVVGNINGYLTTGSNICVERTSQIISKLPLMMIGSMARDGGHLILSESEKQQLVKEYPESRPLLKRLTGTTEFIKGNYRWCLWIEDKDLPLAKSIPPIKTRISLVLKFRMESDAKTTNEYAKIPHKFAQRLFKDKESIVVPSTSSERREYVPIGYFPRGVVITNSANAIYDASPLVFGIVSSRLHMVWIRSIGGQLETRIRYSPEICYNTFPVKEMTKSQEKRISDAALAVLNAREEHPDKNIEFLYDPDTMPDNLRTAHGLLDRAVEDSFRTSTFQSDEQRLDYLLKLYEQVTRVADA